MKTFEQLERQAGRTTRVLKPPLRVYVYFEKRRKTGTGQIFGVGELVETEPHTNFGYGYTLASAKELIRTYKVETALADKWRKYIIRHPEKGQFSEYDTAEYDYQIRLEPAR